MITIISQSFYNPAKFPFLAAFFDHLLDGDTTSAAVLELSSILSSTDYAHVQGQIVTGQPLVGIHCSDNDARVSTLEEYLPSAEKLHRTSRIMAPADSFLAKTCPQWKIEPKERYKGDFNVKTKNPVLFVGNTWDGHTPLVSAKNVSAGFEGSRVLEVRGWGVCIFAPSCYSMGLTLFV